MMIFKRGFTLVEVMVVLAVVGISMALAAPYVLDIMARHRLKGAARQVMSDMMWARMEAVSEHNEFKVFIISDHEYEILDDDDNDGKVDGNEWAGVRNIRDEYHDVSIRFSTNPIFFPRGSASAGTVTLTNPSGAKKVKIHLTGRVKMG